MNPVKDQHKDQYKDLADEEVLKTSITRPNMFEGIVDRYQEAFFRKAQRVLRNEEDAQDAVQETFVKIYCAAPRFQKTKGASFKSWGYAILMNTCISVYRKNKRRMTNEVGLDPDLSDVIKDDKQEDETTRLYMREEIFVLLSHIPDKLARALRLHAIDGYSYKEVAEKEGVTLSVVKSRIHRAKEKLKQLSNLFA